MSEVCAAASLPNALCDALMKFNSSPPQTSTLLSLDPTSPTAKQQQNTRSQTILFFLCFSLGTQLLSSPQTVLCTLTHLVSAPHSSIQALHTLPRDTSLPRATHPSPIAHNGSRGAAPGDLDPRLKASATEAAHALSPCQHQVGSCGRGGDGCGVPAAPSTFAAAVRPPCAAPHTLPPAPWRLCDFVGVGAVSDKCAAFVGAAVPQPC